MDVRICVVFLVLGGTFALSGKGFFCRDPDTGKLHAVNTTWRSTAFCGNYTCKLRMKDIPSTPPIREFKVSNANLSGYQIPQTESLSQSVQNKTDEEKIMSNIFEKIVSDLNEANTTAKVNKTTNEDKKDRYLNDREIKMISDMLHSVKKSDLEAVVDLYNLAQEIYKELDKKTSENLVEETVNEIQTSGRTEIMQHQEQNKLTASSTSGPKLAHDKPSYWYDPSIISQKVRPLPDLNSEGSDIIPTLYPAQTYTNTPFHSSLIAFQNYGKQPFFYDLTDFQRQSSYVHSTPLHPSTQENSFTQLGTEKSPTLQPTVLSPHVTEKQQPLLLPFPYYQVHYNTYNATGFPQQYYYGVNPYYDTFRKEYNKYYVSPETLIEQGYVPERSYKPGTLLDALLPKDDNKNKKPDWKTDSLPDNVLEDIRGHVEKSIIFKPICLRKKIKLDRVRKVTKVDDVKREKRNAPEDVPNVEKDDDHFEVYIERTTCRSDVDPGFFRMGNDSAPYPACCPQRIS